MSKRSQNLYRTPFSAAYWRDALADFRSLRIMVFAALMVAACVALAQLDSVPVVNNIGIKWGFLARSLAGLVCGPVTGLVFGVAEDTISYLFHPMGAYNPFYIITTVLGVETYALLFYRAKVTLPRIVIAKLLTNLQNIFIGGLGTYLFYSSKGYWAIVTGSAVKNLAMLPVQIIALCVLYAALLPVLHRAGFLPDQAGRLALWWKKEPGSEPKPAQTAGDRDPWEQ